MTESRQTRAPVGLTTPLQYVKGVGPHRAKQLERKGLVTVGDALFHLPLRHEDRTRLTPRRAIRPGEVVTCAGVVAGISPAPPGRRRQPLVILLRDESGYGTATVWGRPWLARAAQRGQRVIVHGRGARYKDKGTLQAQGWGTAGAAGDELLGGLRASLPFSLTAAQERVWDDIRRDMAAPYPMHRLLQGDVGSGKTVVAALAVCAAVEAGYQTAVMAPTEILAEQHLATFRRLLEPLGIKVTLLTSGLKAKERATRRAAIASGEIGCVIGTHALVQESVEFRRLGLAVVDEQHRFGVHQRARLKGKGERPDVLVMTATTISRSLALTLYGHLDASVLDELPPGRKPVRTDARTESRRRQIYDFLRAQIADGRQVYVVYPLVEESELVDLKAATDMAQHLQRDVFPDLTVGLLHGRLSSENKDAVMQSFKAGAIQVLVATTVIEVGI